MKIEFQAGDKVTYCPAGTPLPAMVRGVRQNPMNFEIEYKLVSFPKASHSVAAITTGRSIVESELYVAFNGEE